MTVVDKIWYTRCPVPTASGLAHNLGWLADEFSADGLDVGILQDAPPEIARHHFDHQLPGLFREGGNVPALVAKSEGAPTRLVGLTWIDEWQSILVRPDSTIDSGAGLAGARVALPKWGPSRAESFPRAMALHGIKGALRTAGLTLDDVTFVEVSSDVRSNLWPGLTELAAGKVDAVYVKGARSAEQATEIGLRVAVDLDAHADRRTRVNNGTPRPITVHESLLTERPDLVDRFLVRTLQAAQWAADHLDDVRSILARETRSGSAGVTTAYRDGFHQSLHPDLSRERLDLLTLQKDFLLVHGFLSSDVDIEAWAAPEPLERARDQLSQPLLGAFSSAIHLENAPNEGVTRALRA